MIAWLGAVLARCAGPVAVTFSDAVAIGGDSAVQVVVARSKARESVARRDEVAGSRLPKVALEASQTCRSYNFLTGGLEYQGMEPRVPYYSIQQVKAKASMPLLSFDLNDRIREVEGASGLKEKEADLARENARVQAGTSWIELAKAQALLSDRQAALEISRELGRIAEDLHKAGSATGLDLVRAQGQILQAERACATAELAREKAASALASLLGYAATDSVVAAGSLPMEPASTASIAAAQETAPVAVARAGLDLAKVSEESTRHTHIPTIALSADYGNEGRYLWDDGEWVGAVALMMRVELWDGFAEGARKAQARERVLQSSRSVAQARRDAQRNLSEAGAVVRQAAQALELSKQACAMADSELVLSRDRYEGGASGNLEVVQAQGSRTQSHTAWIEAAAAYQVAVLRLRWIAGDWRGL